MRKILFVFSLALALVLSGCNFPGSGTCTVNHTGTGQPLIPGETYLIIYSQTLNPTIIISRTAGSNGTITVASHGQPCTSLVATRVTNSNLALAASPSSVYLPSPPATATITGQSFDTTYGMPTVEYFDSNGYMIGSVYASFVSSDGTSLQASVPDLSSVYSGTYQVKVTNKTYEGYYAAIVGSATMTGWGRDRVDSDGDGWYDDEDCDPYDPYRNSSCIETCGGHDNVELQICPY
jgi:hypothetical protein